MARARWEQTALVCLLLHNNGFNKPLDDPAIFNPYADRRQQAPAAKARMTMAELGPLMDRANGPKP